MSISQNRIQQIYCDESGFIGNNLLDQRDPFFAYATVAICHEEAKYFTAKIIQDYGLQGGELKFKNLIRHGKGESAILKVLEHFSPNTKVAINNKKYNLGCKFYEYIFDPLIKSKNSIFYSIGFHKFISNILYVHFQAQSDSVEDIFNDFYSLMMNEDDKNLVHLFGSMDSENLSPPIEMIRKFCIAQKSSICRELSSLQNNGSSKWILDLTHTALFALLGDWGKEFNQLEVFCDISKPLQEQDGIFQAMIGNKERLILEESGKQHVLGFNLFNTIKYVDSKTFPGVQIADVFAGAFTYLFREASSGNSKNGFKEWMVILEKCVSPYSIVPDYEYVNLESDSTYQNYLILEEFARRSILNIPLLDGFCESIPAHDVHSKFTNFLKRGY